MRKLLTIIGAIALIIFIRVIFIQADDISEDKGKTNESLIEKLVNYKWVNYSDGYYTTRSAKKLKPEETVERYKTFTFKEEKNIFIMDSVKQRFTGKWKIKNKKIYLYFDIKKVVHLSKNTDPNSMSNAYSTLSENLKLKNRVATVEGDIMKSSDGFTYEKYDPSYAGLVNFFEFSGFANAKMGHFIMMLVGIFFIFLAIKYDYEPLLLIPIGTGILMGNIPMFQAIDFNLKLGIYEPGSVMNYLYQGVVQGWYPPLIFLGIGAMTDFSSLISNPRLMLLGAAAQIGIFATFLGSLLLGFAPQEAGAIGIIGSYCHSRLFLYGTCSSNSAAYNKTSYN